jgi:hypothetical protein
MYVRLTPFNMDFVADSNELLDDQLLQIATDMTGGVLYHIPAIKRVVSMILYRAMFMTHLSRLSG